MNTQPPSHQDGSLPFTYYLVVLHPSEPKVFVTPHEAGWSLPSFTPEVRDFRSVAHIGKALKEGWDIDGTVLRCLLHHYDADARHQHRVYLVECHDGPASEHWVWMDQLGEVHAPEDVVEAIDAWAAEDRTGRTAELRAQWARLGWFQEATRWIHDRLDGLELQTTGPVEQVRAWALSCILKVPTGAGDIYFKAVPPYFAQEPKVIQALARRRIPEVPHPLAVDIERGWMLTGDIGDRHLFKESDLAVWEGAVRRFAELQVGWADEPDKAIVSAVPHRDLDTLAAQAGPLLNDAKLALVDTPWGLTAGEMEALQTALPELRERCRRLGEYRIPRCLVHGDLGGNVLVNGTGYVYFDWTDACIAHPFMDVSTLLDTIFDETVLSNAPDVERRVRDAYLGPWSAYESPERLREAYDIARPLGALHQALSYRTIVEGTEPNARWEIQSGLPTWLRTTLRLLSR